MLQLGAGVVAQRADLVRQRLAGNIVERFAEDIGLPDPVDVSVEALKQEVDDILRGCLSVTAGERKTIGILLKSPAAEEPAIR